MTAIISTNIAVRLHDAFLFLEIDE